MCSSNNRTNHCPLPIIVTSQNHLPSLLKIAPLCPSLRVIVSMDPLPASERVLLNQWAASVNIEFFTMDELEAKGAQAPCKPGPEEGEEELDLKRICTISYTSGTTGTFTLILFLLFFIFFFIFLMASIDGYHDNRRSEGSSAYHRKRPFCNHLQRKGCQSGPDQRVLDVSFFPPPQSHVSTISSSPFPSLLPKYLLTYSTHLGNQL